MEQTFKVGDKVNHRSAGHGEITYGPFSGAFDTNRYLMRATDGREWVSGAIELTAAPAFAVGDTVTGTFTRVSYEIIAGPFQSDEITWYAVRHEDGREIKRSEWELKPASVTLEDTIKPGDRVRVLVDHANSAHVAAGDVFTVASLETSAVAGVRTTGVPSRVRGWFFSLTNVEKVADASIPYAYDGTIYDLSAEYTDRDGDVWRFALIDGKAFGGCGGDWDINASDFDTLEDLARLYGPLIRV